VRAAFHAGATLQNEASILVSEYIQRKRLAKLGFTTDLEQLDTWTAEAFILIDHEIDVLQDKKSKEKPKNGRRK